MKSISKITFIIAGIYFAVQLLTGWWYPLFRDELYYIECANHLAFGYVDQPPFSIFILSIWKGIFGSSIVSLRIIPAFIGACSIIFTALLINEMGGGKASQVLAAVSVLSTPVYFIFGGTYSMNAFDLFFWILLFYLFIKIINTQNEKLWIWFGVIAGLGLMNKISILYFGAGIVIAMFFTAERKWFKNKFFWLGGLTAFIIFSPYIIWNIQHGFATIEFIYNATQYKNENLSIAAFLGEQVLQQNPFNILIWLTGLVALFISKELSKYRIIGIVFIIISIILVVNNAKSYYLAAAYPPLICAGSIFIISFFASRSLNYITFIYGCWLVCSMAVIFPLIAPFFELESLARYMKTIGVKPSTGEKADSGQLPQYFADRFGWEEMTQKVSVIYKYKLLPYERKKTIIYTQNYGEASAINYYREKYNLPKAVSGHNNYWIWGPGNDSAATVIIVGGNEEDHLKSFEEVEVFKDWDYPEGRGDELYSMPYELNAVIYLCRKPRRSIKELWQEVKEYI